MGDSESCEDEVDFVSSYITEFQGNDCFLCSADVFEVRADDDDKKADDDDSKNDDDDTRSSKSVSKTTFAVTLAFMIFGLTVALTLSAYIVVTSRRSKDNDVDTKSTNGSIV